MGCLHTPGSLLDLMRQVIFFLSLSFFWVTVTERKKQLIFFIQEKASSELGQVSGFAESFGGIRLPTGFQ